MYAKITGGDILYVHNLYHFKAVTKLTLTIFSALNLKCVLGEWGLVFYTEPAM